MSRKPERKSHLQNAESVLQALLQNSKFTLSQGFTRWRLEREWPKVVGAAIAANTAPCAMEKGILYVWVKHSTWVQQLYYFKDTIREKVNAHIGSQMVTEVRLTLDKRALGRGLKEAPASEKR